MVVTNHYNGSHNTATLTNGDYIMDINIEVKRTATVSGLDLSSRDWQIFTSVKGHEAAASKLNRLFMEAVNMGYTRIEVENVMYRVMTHLSKFGARDSEPRYVLSRLLDEVFGEV